MKKYIFILATAMIILGTGTLFTPVKANITAATYNVTHGNKNNWSKRQPYVCELIKKMNKDIYCFQEVIKKNNQLKAIKATLPNHDYIGKPRSYGIKGLSLWHRLVTLSGKLGLGGEDEYCPIFYNQNTVTLIAEDTFGINGKGWTSALLPRICTWGHFKETATQKEFYVYNTHLDNKQADRRIMQIQLIFDDIAQRCGDSPVILMGDFNTAITEDIQKNISTAQFTNAKEIAQKIEGPTQTHKKSSTKELTQIDHILIKPQELFKIYLYKVLDVMSKKTSDHNPVSITFSFK